MSKLGTGSTSNYDSSMMKSTRNDNTRQYNSYQHNKDSEELVNTLNNLTDSNKSTIMSSNNLQVMNIKISGDRAPWMIKAIEESVQWGDKTEGNITDNYFQLISIDYDSMKGDGRKWCAAFVNYCLDDSGYEMVTTDTKWDKVRAKAFKKDTKNFIRIDVPAYGAIAVTKKGSHVCFVIGREDKENFFRLGGNQDDRITFEPKSINEYIYYFPKPAWLFHSKKPAAIVSLASIKNKGVNYRKTISDN